MPQTQLQPLRPQLKEIIDDVKRSAKIDIQQVIQKIDSLFNSVAKKIFRGKTVEEILKNPHSQDSKDLNAACAMFMAFKAKILEILTKAWALLVQRIPIPILKKYAGSVVETTLAALTAALMWAHKHQTEIVAQTGKSSVFSNTLEMLIKSVSLCIIHVEKMAEIRSDLTAAYRAHHAGATETQAAAAFDDMIRATLAHLIPDRLSAFISQVIARLEAEPLNERLVGDMLAQSSGKGMDFLDNIDACKAGIAKTMGINPTAPEATGHAESLIHHIVMNRVNDSLERRAKSEYRQDSELEQKVDTAVRAQNH